MIEKIEVKNGAVKQVVLELSPIEALLVADAMCRYKNDIKINEDDREMMKSIIHNRNRKIIS